MRLPTPAHVVHELQTRVAVLEVELAGERRRADTAEAYRDENAAKAEADQQRPCATSKLRARPPPSPDRR